MARLSPKPGAAGGFSGGSHPYERRRRGMIKRNQAALNRLNAFLDFALVILSYLVSSWFRLYVLDGNRGNMALTKGMIVASMAYAVGLMIVLAMMGFYSTTRMRRLSWRLETIFIAVSVTVLIASTLLFVFRLEDFSRGVLLIFYLLTLALLCGKYAATRLALEQLRAQGFNIKHQVVIGTGRLARQYIQDVAGEPELGIQIDRSAAVGDAAAVEAALARPDIDEAVIALEPEEYIHITRLIAACEKNGVKYLVIPFYNDLIPAHPVIENVGRSKLINMRANRLEDIGWAALKRGFDIIVSAAGLIALSPLLLALAVGVKLSSPGPILFRQERVGYNRRNFMMLKFRSMRVNAAQDTAWSTAVDSRRTRFGSFIRKTSLDELPQLFNVLRGDMSLVGPRPELPHFVEQFRETIPLYMVKHQVRPGITGWAQANGYRGDTSIEKRIELDLWYIENWSPLLDLKILFMTVPGAMINGESMAAAEDLDVKVVVAAHKPYWMPADRLYVPVQVGAAGRAPLGFTRDDAGDNISDRNATFCELTGLYWAWKNLDCDYLGLAHYRRHFSLKRMTRDRRAVLTLSQAQALLSTADAILPKKRHYWIETNYSQYAHAHHAEDLDETRRIIAERCPEYLPAFDAVMKRTTGHRFNMFIMKRALLDRYCAWLFGILFELERRLDISGYNANDKRVFGFVAERLLDVWLETNRVKTRANTCIPQRTPSCLQMRSTSPKQARGMTLVVETSSLVISSLKALRINGSALSFIVILSNMCFVLQSVSNNLFVFSIKLFFI